MKLFRNLTLTLGLSTLLFAGSTLTLGDEPKKVTVYKTPTCGCCKKWVTHLEKSGFEVETIDMRDLGMIKSMSGVEPKLASCHTAQVGGYVIEGHVPADDIKRLLSERPAVKGLTVPGMPHGSPGMETGHKAPYQVLTFDAEGKTQVFAQH